MINFGKPKIGLLGLIIEGYESIFPGIIKCQENFAREVISSLNEIADIYFTGASTNRQQIEKTVSNYENLDLDGILIICLAYSHSTWLARALQKNSLPIALAVIQPENSVGVDWNEYNFTLNQGIHGAQDNANIIARLGIGCEFFAGNRHSERFKQFFMDFSKAAQAYKFLKKMRVAVIGKMTGMGDLLNDEMAMLLKIGPEFCYETIGSVYKAMELISKEEIDKRITYEKSIFSIDTNLTYARHAHAVKQYLALKRFLQDNNFDAFSLHFEVLGQDGRFEQLSFLAASNLMADGYGYAAEGDAMTAAAVSIGQCLSNMQANFSEMYAMDFNENALLFCHAGESNWAICKNGIKPRLIDKVFGEGGLDNPPTPLFTPQPGFGTVVSFTPLIGSDFKFVVSKGEILSKSDLKGCEMPYMFFRPNTGIERCIENWLHEGGTHHQVITLGDTSSKWKMLAKMLDIKYVEV